MVDVSNDWETFLKEWCYDDPPTEYDHGYWVGFRDRERLEKENEQLRMLLEANVRVMKREIAAELEWAKQNESKSKP
jgi:hypothetical protein